jgi:hypothetical protein
MFEAVAFACSAHAETTSLPTLTFQKSWFMIWLDPKIIGKQIILDIPIDMFPNVSPCFSLSRVSPCHFFCWAWRQLVDPQAWSLSTSREHVSGIRSPRTPWGAVEGCRLGVEYGEVLVVELKVIKIVKLEKYRKV